MIWSYAFFQTVYTMSKNLRPRRYSPFLIHVPCYSVYCYVDLNSTACKRYTYSYMSYIPNSRLNLNETNSLSIHVFCMVFINDIYSQFAFSRLWPSSQAKAAIFIYFHYTRIVKVNEDSSLVLRRWTLARTSRITVNSDFFVITKK